MIINRIKINAKHYLKPVKGVFSSKIKEVKQVFNC